MKILLIDSNWATPGAPDLERHVAALFLFV